MPTFYMKLWAGGLNRNCMHRDILWLRFPLLTIEKLYSSSTRMVTAGWVLKSFEFCLRTRRKEKQLRRNHQCHHHQLNLRWKQKHHLKSNGALWSAWFLIFLLYTFVFLKISKVLFVVVVKIYYIYLHQEFC